MKFIHLADLHIGKRINEYSMLEDQEYILTKIINIIDEEKLDAVVIAGDVYDKSVPSVDSVQLFDDFLCRLSQRNLKTFVISGNHDSQERIAFGSRLMHRSGIYMSPVYDGKIVPIQIEDEFGKINVFMLPFVKPSSVRRYFPDEEINNYSDAVRLAVKQMEINADERNILITHQFVAGAQRCESEELSVGGSDAVDGSIFKDFDYTALGHIHSPQNAWGNLVRYCGTPLKYSFSEAKQDKSVTIVEIKEKKQIDIKTVPLVPKRDMREIKGTYGELTLKSFYENTTYQDDYMHITLTNEEDIPDAIGKLRTIYHNIMKLDYDNKRTRTNNQIIGAEKADSRTPLDLFKELYEKQNNAELSEIQEQFVCELIREIWEGEK